MRNNTKIQIPLRRLWRELRKSSQSMSPWSYDVGGSAEKGVARNCELACKKRVLLKAGGNAMHGCSSQEFSTVCKNWHQWSTDCVLPRLVSKWDKACAKRLARLTSYIKHTEHHTQHCVVGDKNEDSKLGLGQDASFRWRFARFQINLKRSIVRIWITNRCSNVLDA